MTRPQQLAHKNISRFWLCETSEHKPSLCDWNENDYRFVFIIVVGMARRIKLSPEREFEEVAKVIEMFIKLEEENEKAKDEAAERRMKGLIKQNNKKSIKKETILPVDELDDDLHIIKREE